MAGYYNNYLKNNNHLHPYYAPSWNNPLSAPLPLHHRKSNISSRPGYYVAPMPRSPVGLTEVLSSYTPGPTIIMFEKEKKPRLSQNWFFRLACLLIVLLTIALITWSQTYAKSEDIPEFLEPKLQPVIELSNEKDNLSGYTYLNEPQIIFSYDDDEETWIEDVTTYAL